MRTATFQFSESGGSLTGPHLFTELPFLWNPYQTPDSLNRLAPFHWKRLFFTEKCFVASLPKNRLRLGILLFWQSQPPQRERLPMPAQSTAQVDRRVCTKLCTGARRSKVLAGVRWAMSRDWTRRSWSYSICRPVQFVSVLGSLERGWTPQGVSRQ